MKLTLVIAQKSRDVFQKGLNLKGFSVGEVISEDLPVKTDLILAVYMMFMQCFKRIFHINSFPSLFYSVWKKKIK